jgi:hypothetical protein
VAKKSSNKDPVQNFLTDLATQPGVLLDFIKDPVATLRRYGIRDSADIEHISNLVALEVSKKLMVVQDHAFIHW